MAIAEFTGASADCCEKFLDWMAHENLVFAPASFQETIDEITHIAITHMPEVEVPPVHKETEDDQQQQAGSGQEPEPESEREPAIE